MQEEYKGCLIKYMEYNGNFEAKIGESSFMHRELAKVREKIDRILKPVFNRETVLLGNSWSKDFVIADVTSQNSDSPKEFWVVTADDNKRSKENIANLYVKSLENEKKIQAIAELAIQRDCISKKMEEMRNSMEKYQYKKEDGLNGTRS